MRTGILPMLAGLALFTAACVSGTPGAETARGNRNVITRQQMIDVNATSVYDAVQKLQGSWLTTRGPTSITDETPTMVSVYMTGSDMGGVEFLRRLRPDDVNEIRYYESGEASARFGLGHQRGVIEVIPRGVQ
jgi:hypothetical protein